eukprot:11593131-Alexandrium_andersonii.AAC.1
MPSAEARSHKTREASSGSSSRRSDGERERERDTPEGTCEVEDQGSGDRYRDAGTPALAAHSGRPDA